MWKITIQVEVVAFSINLSMPVRIILLVLDYSWIKRVAFIKNNYTFPKNIPKYLLMKELESYCGTIYDTIYAYVEDYHTCSGIFS